MQIRPDVELANASDVGPVRETNEDYFLYCEPEDEEEFARRGRLILVTDGMGGHQGGATASRLAAEAVRRVFLESDSTEPRQVLIEGFQLAQAVILAEAADDPLVRGMGTTCSAAIVCAGKLYLGHIGDSRVYLLRRGEARQLTEDHSLVAQMAREGLITEEQAKNHEKRNVLTQALGVSSDNLAGDFSTEPLDLEIDDILLLCTDGLHGLVEGFEMALTVAGQSLSEACRELIALAIVRGGADNITLQTLAIRQVTQ
jgi:PPM family protein phosphatase